MKKLQSLESFKASGLSKKFMSKLGGGTNPEITPGGCILVENLERTSTGVMAYTSDEKVEGGGINYQGCTDPKTCPED